jgi:hypothetical protein
VDRTDLALSQANDRIAIGFVLGQAKKRQSSHGRSTALYYSWYDWIIIMLELISVEA